MLTVPEMLMNRVNFINKNYPGLFRVLEQESKNSHTRDKDRLPDYIYLHIGDVMRLVCHINDTLLRPIGKRLDAHYTNVLFQAAYVCACWRVYKKIYYVDQDLVDCLVEQSRRIHFNDISIPTSVLKNLPFNCIFIKADMEYKGSIYKGFFAMIDREYQNNGKYIDSMTFIPTKLEEDTNPKYKDGFLEEPTIFSTDLIDDISIGEMIQRTSERLSDTGYYNKNDFSIEDEFVKKMFNILIYILSANSDIQYNKVQASTYKPREKNAPIKDKFREIEAFDVGYRIGAAIRENRKVNVYNNGIKNGEPKRKMPPHIRCGHYHKYWTGRRDHPEERKIVIRWIPPVFINGFSEKSNIVSIVPVESSVYKNK